MTSFRSIPRGMLLVLSVVSLAGTRAWAQTYPAPEATPASSGSYTVSYWPDCTGIPYPLICAFTLLQEKAGSSGAWTSVSSGTGSISFQSKPPGTYYYRVYVGAYDPNYTLMSGYSPAITVAVGTDAVREPITRQMGYHYEVRQGDFNGDSRTDLLLMKSADAGRYDGTIEHILMQQLADGHSFAPVVPSAAQFAAASRWPLSQVEPVVADINVDGYVDVTLNKVSAAVGAAPDQIVFAPGRPGVAEPIGVRPFDARLSQYTSDMLDYFVDQDYFIDNAPYHLEVWVDWYAFCDPWYFTDMDTAYWAYLPGCYYYYDFDSVVYQDFSVFSQEAIQFWANDQDAINGFIEEDEALDEVEQAAEDLLTTPIGGWEMEEILGPVGEHVDPFVRRGIEIAQSVLGQARGGRNATTSKLMPPQTDRVPDQIYITGHPLSFARSRGHLALEYADSLAGGAPFTGATISAEPEHNNFFNFGKLIARDNRPTDDPLLNFYVGDVDPQMTSNLNYWTSYLMPRHAHYKALPYSELPDYSLVPDAESGTNNSNSYVSGITYDSPGNVSISVPFGIQYRYPGWGEPVPDVKFR